MINCVIGFFEKNLTRGQTPCEVGPPVRFNANLFIL